jgi:outer membrane lipoprotein carrier protein
MRVLSLLCGLCLLAMPTLAAPKADAATKLLARVQKFYDRTKDLTADVDQRYVYTTMGRTLTASGAMQLKKPGFLRWEIVKPSPKSYVVDGKSLYLYDAEENEVLVRRDFSADGLSAAVTFLWGRGRLARDFTASLVPRPDLGEDVLQLVPKKPASGFQKLFFAVDAKTGLVKKSVVVDPEGNENTLAFSNVKTNVGLKDEAFRFVVPKGATVTER